MSRFRKPAGGDGGRTADDRLPSERRTGGPAEEGGGGRWLSGGQSGAPAPVRGRGCLVGLALLALPLVAALCLALQFGSWEGTDPFIVHMEQGRTLSHAQKLPEALAEFEAAKELRPELAGPRDGIAVIYLEQGRLAEGEAVCKDGLALVPDDSSLHLTLGLIYSQQDREDLEVAEYMRAIECDVTNAYAHFDLGLVYQKRGERTLAIRELEAALRHAAPADDIVEKAHRLLSQLREP